MAKDTCLKISQVERQMSDLFDRGTGKILTIIDAVIVEEKSNKAVKDLIRDVFSEMFNEKFQAFRSAETLGEVIPKI